MFVSFFFLLSTELHSDCLRGSVNTDISGVPGTGKTATVHAIVRELKRMAEESVHPIHIFFSIANLL